MKMNKFRSQILSIMICLTMVLSILPVKVSAQTDNLVSREQAIVSILNTVGLGALNETEAELGNFLDADLITEDYKDEMAIAVSNGIVFGSGTTLDPHRDITRLEFALFLSRSLRELPTIKESSEFSDVPLSKVGDVERLVEAGLFYGYGNGEFGINDYLTQEQLNAVMRRIEDLENTDLKDDFFYAVNYDWLATTKLPAGYPGLTSFDEITINNDNKIKEIANEIYAKKDTYEDGTIEQKLADFYSSALDMENRNKQGIEPIIKYLDKFAQVKTAQELLDYAAEFENETGLNPVFSFGPSNDLLDSNKYSLYGQGLTTGLPAAYYLLGDAQIQGMFEYYMAQVLMLTGVDAETAMAEANKIYEFENIIAQSTMSNEAASNIQNIYNPVSRDDLKSLFTSVDLDKYMNDLGYESVDTIIIPDVLLMAKTGELLNDENIEVLKSYVNMHLIISASSYLSKDFQDAIHAFNAMFLGINSTLSDEEIAFNLMNSVMSSYLGKIYVEKYFSPEAKTDVEAMVGEIIEVFKKRVDRLDWMSEETKAAAIVKLDTITVKIGHPDDWNDPFVGIELKNYEDGGSLIENISAITSASAAYAKTLLDKNADKSGWAMSPQTVNAYYNPLNNEIVFPAGILQAPFYDVNASREQNLGGIGAVIAHEITHAFDQNGARFDEKGNMNNWWTEADYLTFQEKCMDIVGVYDGLKIAPNARVNGVLTLSENVADIGGVACVLEIMESIPDADYDEFFKSNAGIWRITGTPQLYQMLAQQDTHSPNKFRTNIVLSTFQEFYDTYDIQEDDYMYLDQENRITIW